MAHRSARRPLGGGADEPLQIGEGFIVALAVRQSLPDDLFELAEIEGAAGVRLRAGDPSADGAGTRSAALPGHDLQLPGELRPGAADLRRGPPPYATTYLPLFVYTNAFEYLRYGYAAAATLVMFAVTALIVFAQWRILRRWRLASSA